MDRPFFSALSAASGEAVQSCPIVLTPPRDPSLPQTFRKGSRIRRGGKGQMKNFNCKIRSRGGASVESFNTS